MGTTRAVYNTALYHVKNQEKFTVDKKLLQRLFVTRKHRDGTLNTTIPEWQFETPKDIRNGAIRDLYKATKTAFSHLKTGFISKFKMGFKRKKSFPSVEIPKSALNYKNGKLMLYPRFIPEGIKISKRDSKLPIEYDCRLQWTNGCWFLVVPYKKLVTSQSSDGICALDPGSRTFQTVYSETEVVKIQQNPELLEKYRKKLDKLQSLKDKKTIKVSSYTRARKRVMKKLGFLIQELHYKTIHYLKKYKWILLPSFESQEMVQGKIHRKTKRNLLNLQHYQFKQRIFNALELNSDSNVLEVTEEYTSKTCGSCGKLNDVGSSRTFKCSQCNLKIDRDVNGARNILLKFISV
jgi:putative transposase